MQQMIEQAFRYHHTGHPVEAERLCRQILATVPRHADSLHLLGILAFQAGRREDASRSITTAIAIDSQKSAYHSNLGTVLMAMGKLDAAAACYQRALALKPDFVEAQVNLAGVFLAQGKLQPAAEFCRQALALKPDLAEANLNLGAVLHAQGIFHESLAYCQRAVSLKPNLAEAHHNLGRVFRALGRIPEAASSYRQALLLQPAYTQARFSQSLLQLLQGDFTGWPNYELRWQSPDHNTPMRSYPQPLWKGEALNSPLLIWGEQGIGDEIMFAGLIPDLLRAGHRCLLDCDPRLRPLFARSFPAVEVVSSHASNPTAAPDFAAHIPSGSLPAIFRSSAAAFRSTTSPYLVSDPLARQQFRTRYADGRRVVGLAWHTRSPQSGHLRSIDLSTLAPLFGLPGIRWISLQYGDHADLTAQIAAARAPILVDPAVDQFADLDTFASQVAAMDEVITIDNSTAHLAGALGIPVALLLPFAPDWRWLQHRDRSPWYPSMRLFRQPTFGDWRSAVQQLHHVCASASLGAIKTAPEDFSSAAL